MSLLLQNKLRDLGQMSCSLLDNKSEVSVNGGWCSIISGKNSSRHITDERLLRYLSKFLAGKLIEFYHKIYPTYRVHVCSQRRLTPKTHENVTKTNDLQNKKI